MSLKPPSRPFDPTGMALRNLITAEIKNVSIDENPTAVMSHGPFYTKSFIATSGGKPLKLGTHFKFLLIDQEATVITGKEVACVVQLLDKTIERISCTYQAVGGEFQDMFNVLERLTEEIKERPGQPISWDNISNKPETYPPTHHRHHVDEMGNHRFLADPLDEIRNALEHKAIKDIEILYTIIENGLSEYRKHLNGKIDEFRDKILSARNMAVFPLNFLLLSTAELTDARLPDGSWVPWNKDSLLYGVSKATDMGKEWRVSDQLVFPLPSDLLLDEEDNPVKTVTNDYIYLDNGQTPNEGGVGDINYEGSISTIFNSRAVAVYRKVGNGSRSTLTLSKTLNGSSLIEGERVQFQLETVGYPFGSVFTYFIEGVSSDNIDVPLQGTVTTNDFGIATLSVKLLPDSPRTDQSTLSFNVIDGPTTYTETCPYQLNSNLDVNINITVCDSPYGTKVDEMVRGDTLWLRINTLGLLNKNVSFKAEGLTSAETWAIDGTRVSGTTTITKKITTNVMYLPIVVDQKAVNAVLDIQFSLTSGSHVGKTPIKVQPFKILSSEFFSTESLNAITEVARTHPFQIRVKTNSIAVNIMDFTVGANPSFIKPAPFWSTILTKKMEHLESANFRFEEVLKAPTTITYNVLSPYTEQKLSVAMTLKLLP